jgi:hypothetical protein
LYKAIALQEVAWHAPRRFGLPVKVLFVKADYRVGNLAVLVEALGKLAPTPFFTGRDRPRKAV